MLKLSPARAPQWYGIPLRVAFITFLLTLLGFAVSLLLGIIGLLVFARLHGTVPNLTAAYRQIAFPAAITIGAIVFVSAIVIEVRHYRRGKELARLEQIMNS